MAVKYYCPRCEKRFVDWGAEKLKYQCPACEGEKLLLVGSQEDAPAKRPTLRRRPKAEAVVAKPLIEEDDDVIAVEDEDVVDLEVDPAVVATDDVEEDAEIADEEEEVDEETLDDEETEELVDEEIDETVDITAEDELT